MKKRKVTRRNALRKTVKRTVPRSTKRNQTILFRRLIIFSACLVLFVLGLDTVHKGTFSQAVAGMQITKGVFYQATVPLVPPVNPGYTLASYNIYYDVNGAKTFNNAVIKIPATATQYIVSYLRNGTSYQYLIKAVDSNGAEHPLGGIKPLNYNIQSM